MTRIPILLVKARSVPGSSQPRSRVRPTPWWVVAGCAALVAAPPLNAQSIAINAGSTPAVTIAPGTKLTVPIIIDLTNAGAANIASLAAGLSWGISRLSFDSLRVAGAVGWGFTPNTTNAATGAASFVASNGVALPATATLANAYFTASGTAGGTRVVVAPSGAANATGQSILALLQPRAQDVCIATPVKWGDVNNDGAVNIIDAQQIARFSVSLSVANATALTQGGDVNGDGSVNIIDAQQIARFSVALSAAARINTGLYVPPVSVTLSPSTTQNLSVGGTLQILATPRDGAAADLTGCASFTWTSSNPAVATVTASGGFVTGVANGSATITATSTAITTTPAVTSALTVNVAAAGPPVIRVTVSHTGRTARRYVAQVSGGTIPDYLSYSVTGANMNGASIDVGVPGSGSYTVRIVALDAASGTNIFLVGGQLAVTVPPATSLVTQALTLTPATFTMTTLPTIVTTGVPITIGWTILDPAGIIDGRGTSLLFCGTVQSSMATLASDFGGTATNACTLTRPVPGTLTFSTSASPIAAQATPGTLSLVVRGGNYMRAPPDSIFVFLINPSVTRGESPLSITIAQVATVAVTPATPTVAAGGTQQMTATARDAGSAIITGLPVTWNSVTPSVATVSVAGLVTGIANGTSVVTATIGGVSGNTTVTVSGGVSVGSITVAPLAGLSGNQTTTAVATVRDPSNNIIGAAVTWSSSNPMVARVASDGTVQALGTGTSTITATIGAVSGSQLVTVSQVSQAYNIVIRPLTAMSAGATAAFANAAARWSQVIRGDVPDVVLTNFDVGAVCLGQAAGTTVLNETIDDVVIYATVAPIDGVGGILGQAGPCRTRFPSGQAYIGTMQFDSADIANMEANGTLTAVILHEMGHVLGIGTNWQNLGLLANPSPGSGGDPTFTGVNGQWAFQNLGTGYGGAVVPVENCIGTPGSCGSGTVNSHWRESVLLRELMTGYVTPGVGGATPVNPLSPLTAASLIDLGYVVDVSQADPAPYFLRAAAEAPGQRIEIKEGTMPPPVATDLFGRPVGGLLRAPAIPPPAPSPAPRKLPPPNRE